MSLYVRGHFIRGHVLTGRFRGPGLLVLLWRGLLVDGFQDRKNGSNVGLTDRYIIGSMPFNSRSCGFRGIWYGCLSGFISGDANRTESSNRPQPVEKFDTILSFVGYYIKVRRITSALIEREVGEIYHGRR
jgi:hypothetical protein